MIQARETTIEGVDYSFTPLMADPAREWLDRLSKAFGPSVAAFVEGLGSVKSFKIDLDATDELDLLTMFSNSMGKGIRDFTSALSPSLHKEVVDKFLSQVRYRNEEGNWAPLTKDRRQIMFATALWAETRLLGWCLQEQYADFFVPLRTAIASAAVRMAARGVSRSDSPKVSTGGLGDSSPAAD